MSATHVSEMFQSSIISWSSKIITLGTTDSSQRSHGEDHDSWYSQVNSSNPSTSSGGSRSCAGVAARRSAMRWRATGEESSA